MRFTLICVPCYYTRHSTPHVAGVTPRTAHFAFTRTFRLHIHLHHIFYHTPTLHGQGCARWRHTYPHAHTHTPTATCYAPTLPLHHATPPPLPFWIAHLPARRLRRVCLSFLNSVFLRQYPVPDTLRSVLPLCSRWRSSVHNSLSPMDSVHFFFFVYCGRLWF